MELNCPNSAVDNYFLEHRETSHCAPGWSRLRISSDSMLHVPERFYFERILLVLEILQC